MGIGPGGRNAAAVTAKKTGDATLSCHRLRLSHEPRTTPTLKCSSATYSLKHSVAAGWIVALSALLRCGSDASMHHSSSTGNSRELCCRMIASSEAAVAGLGGWGGCEVLLRGPGREVLAPDRLQFVVSRGWSVLLKLVDIVLNR